MKDKEELMGHISAAVTIFIWGTTFISTKILLKSMTPMEILFLRFTIGFIALSFACPHGFRPKSIQHELYFAAAGLCGVTLYYLLENMALTYTLASNVGIIISIAPFFTAIFSYIFSNGEKLKFQFFIGFITALAGISMISFNGLTALKINPLGDILAASAAVVWAVYSILTKKISSFNYNTVQSTRRIFLYGLVFMIPSLFIFEFHPNIEILVQPVNLFNLLFLGLGASAVCFVTWNSAVKILGAVQTSVYIYLVPVITVITSALVLKEKITVFSVLGIFLTIAGLFVSEQKASIKTIKNMD